MHLNTIVREIRWREGSVKIEVQTPLGNETFEAPRALVTLPLGVLQADTQLRFDPLLPKQKQLALDHLVMGKVLRVTLCFRQAPWNVGRTFLSDKKLGATADQAAVPLTDVARALVRAAGEKEHGENGRHQAHGGADGDPRLPAPSVVLPQKPGSK